MALIRNFLSFAGLSTGAENSMLVDKYQVYVLLPEIFVAILSKNIIINLYTRSVKQTRLYQSSGRPAVLIHKNKFDFE